MTDKIYRGAPPPPPPPRRRPDAAQAVEQAMAQRPQAALKEKETCMWTLEAVQASLVRRAKPQVRLISLWFFVFFPVLPKSLYQ
jgi:hypothetical protein